MNFEWRELWISYVNNYKRRKFKIRTIANKKQHDDERMKKKARSIVSSYL